MQELEELPVVIGADVGVDHADAAQHLERGSVADVGHAEEMRLVGLAEDPVAQRRRPPRWRSPGPSTRETASSRSPGSSSGIDAEAGAADHDAVGLAGRAQLAHPARGEQLDASRRGRCGTRPSSTAGRDRSGSARCPDRHAAGRGRRPGPSRQPESTSRSVSRQRQVGHAADCGSRSSRGRLKTMLSRCWPLGARP